MVKREISVGILNSIKVYLEEVKKYYNLDSVILFGSCAKGANTEDSDIDIAIISKDIKDEFEAGVHLLKLTWKIDTRIEPHAFSISSFNKNPFVQEIVKTGIKIDAA